MTGCIDGNFFKTKTRDFNRPKFAELLFSKHTDVYRQNAETQSYRTEDGKEAFSEIAALIQRGAEFQITLFSDQENGTELQSLYLKLQESGVRKNSIVFGVLLQKDENYLQLTRFQRTLKYRNCSDPSGRYIAGCAVEKIELFH